MKGKTILVTGCTIGGIGFETASELASRGHRLIITSRSMERSVAAADAIAEKNDISRPIPLSLDLSESGSIESFVGELRNHCGVLDVIVNNAGILKRGRFFTSSGQELIKAVNYSGTVELTEKLLPLLAKGGRIVNVTSSVAAYGRRERRKESHGFKAYCDSKQALNTYTIELAERLKPRGISVNAVHPGNIITNIWRDLFPELRIISLLVHGLDKMGFMSAHKGAETLIYLADSPEMEGKTGLYFDRGRQKAWPENVK